MKLLVLVICLLIQRFSEGDAIKRFYWFLNYENFIHEKLYPKFIHSSLALLCIFVLPVVLLTWLLLYTYCDWIFGLVGFLLNILIVCYCLRPVYANQFIFRQGESKPVEGIDSKVVMGDEDVCNTSAPSNSNNINENNEIVNYLIDANNALFAVIFWYLFLGPVAALLYRLVSLSCYHIATTEFALKITAILDWLPVRMTSLLYLLVGNFQAGRKHFFKLFFVSPAKNNELIGGCGVKALQTNSQPIDLRQAQRLVKHAIIALLVMLALFILLHV